jgi:hypothetical protein
MKYSKILEELGQEQIDEINAKSKAELETLIAESQDAIRTATKERDANPKYAEAKQAVKDLSEGLKAVKKRQMAKIELALRLRSGDSEQE